MMIKFWEYHMHNVQFAWKWIKVTVAIIFFVCWILQNITYKNVLYFDVFQGSSHVFFFPQASSSTPFDLKVSMDSRGC